MTRRVRFDDMSESEQKEVLRRRDIGGLKYIEEPCGKCGGVLRYARTMKCVDCVLQSGSERRQQCLEKIVIKERPSKPINGAQDRVARHYAKVHGEETYVGRDCRKCSTDVRYTNRGQCVECVSRRNRKQYADRIGDPLLAMFG